MIVEVPRSETWDRVFEAENGVPCRVNRAVYSTVLEWSRPGDSVLEVGPGEGACAVAIAQTGRDVHVADISEEAIHKTLSLARSKAVHVDAVLADGQVLPYTQDFFSMVYSQGLVEHFPEPEQLVSEMARVTKPGGYVLIDVPQLYSLQHVYKLPQIETGSWPFGWERSYSPEQLIELMQHFGLRPVDAYAWGILPPIPQGMKPHIAKANGEKGLAKQIMSTTLQMVRENNTTPIKAPLAQYTLNNIGILGRKS